MPSGRRQKEDDVTLNELRKKLGNTFKAVDIVTGEVLEVHYLFSNMYGARDEDGTTRFAFGLSNKYREYSKGETMISPEEQKAAREKERKRNNEKVVRDLKRQDAFKAKTSRPLPLKITRKPNPFQVIKGGKDNE